jgi:hypothetical protein
MSDLVFAGDGINGLALCEPGSVGLILSDLPSGETRATFDRVPNLRQFWAVAWAALRDDGVAVLMASNLRFAAELIASDPSRYRYDLIWHKSVAVGFLNARHRPLRAHEFILVFCRGTGTYTPQMRQGLKPIPPSAVRGSSGENYNVSGGAGAGRKRAGATDRFPWSVLPFASVGACDPRRKHPQQKPDDLMRWCIRSYSKAGDLVVDPFAGSGSVGRAALAEGRRFVGWDIDPRFGGPSASTG